ncbi:methyl-accepting chemotaxis protein [Sphingomonas sp. NCPPB 2930]
MKISDWKIRTKLAVAFGLLVVLVVALGAIALSALGRVHGHVQEIGGNLLPSVQILGDMRVDANRIRLAEGVMVMSRTPAQAKVLIAEVGEQRKSLVKSEAAYAPLVSSGEEADGYRGYQVRRDAYLKSLDEITRLSSGDDETSTAEAVRLYAGPSRELFTAFVGAIGQLSQVNKRAADAAVVASADSYSGARWSVAAFVVATLIAGVLLAVWMTRLITGPLRNALFVSQQIAAGNLGIEVDDSSKDEVGLLLTGLAAMRDSLARVVGGVRANAEGVATASAQISQGNNDLSARTEQQASSLEETAASMEELGSTVRQNADNARQANQLAISASAVAVQGGEAVGEVVETMKGINDSSRRIADIIGTIDGIAFQTNILALNAAVEAARAGEQGRGFAVVASEVRSLAQRSAEAAKEIKALITASVQRVEQGTAQVDRAGATMTEVVGSIRRVTDIMGEISAASAEQSAGVGQVSEAVTQMDQATQQNAALVEESAAAAASLRSQAEQLVSAVSVFQLTRIRTPGAAAHAPATVAPAAPIAAPAARAAAAVPVRRPVEGAVSPAAQKPSLPSAKASLPKKLSAPPVKPAAAPAAPAAAASASRAPSVGSDEDWETF